ncbi:bloom syndrome protein [Fusarium oxysporum f. sp. raphani 54005]|uniref:DNA 3'-5' helicase n=1 Tax=Fusarium oxysporum f. sp. raphani 54005 TaxID=1089458 RepID=X0BJ49_FUSOX|nr:bloom syndrome protein [Fusarium oxysporum f. sp. raphani 54005]
MEDDDTMARLKSSSRSRKPGLISRPQQLLSSSSITPNRLARQDASARRTNLSTWSPEPCKTQSPSKTAPASAVVRTLRTSSPNFPDLKADGVEYLDLTNDASESSDSLPFNSNAKLCREDYASRPNLVASSGIKRKRSEISEEGEDGILSPSRYVHSPLAHEQSPRKALPVIDTQHPSKGPTSPLKESAANSEASNPVHQANSLPPRMEDGRDEPFIPDSDGESLMPPSHNNSIAILKISTNKPAQICTHAGPTAMPSVQPDFASLSQRITTSGIAAPRVGAIASNSSQTAKATPEDSFNELPSKTLPESSQTLFLLNQLSSQPSILTKWSEFMDKLIQQNDKNFRRAINERLPKEKRSEIKSEKERLLRQQKAFKQLTVPTDEYRALCRKREELTQVITQAYAQGLDTDEDQVRLDDLIDEIQAVEHVLLKTIDGCSHHYKTLGEVRQKYPGVPVMALTATATQNVIVDIRHNLGMDNCQTFSQSFNRPNLHYEVRGKTTNAKCMDEIASLIKSKYANQSGIVYTVSRKNAEKVAESLSIQGITARHYHAGLDPQEKVEVQTSWQQGQVKIVVATIAFGMGIDKPDVRFVIHHGLPKTLEGYYQETGRAGRDGDPSDCILFYGKQDIRILKKLIADSEGNNEQKERQMSMLNRVTAFCDNKSDCRRVEILRYFGEDFTAAQCRKTCDNCKAGLIFQQREFSEYAIAAIRVVQAQRRITAVQCADILMGRKYPPYEARHSDNWYGMAKSLKKHELVRVLDKLLAEKAFHENNQVGNHGMVIQYLKLGATYRLFLSGQRKLMLSIQVPEEGPANKPSKPRSKQASKKPKDQDVTAMPSPNVSLPVGRRIKKSRTVKSDDENGVMTLNGYANDGFMVHDNEDEEAIEELPDHQPLKPPSRSPGLPIPISAELKDLNEIHRDIVNGFVREAKVAEEKIRKRKGLRSPLFTEKELQVMAIRWTTSLNKMSKIPSIQLDKVMIHGPEILRILRRYYSGYREVMDPKCSGSNDREIVDLLSSDAEMGEDAYEEEDGEDSPYFNTNRHADIRA